MTRSPFQQSQGGFSLIEVMIAVVIFAIGMLALASLQGSLTRSAGDASLRTTAVNIAERTIEDFRAFRRIDTDPDGVLFAYNDIVDTGDAYLSFREDTRDGEGAIEYRGAVEVTDYYYNKTTDQFTESPPEGIVVSAFKLVEVTVSWDTGAGFQINETDVDLGTGSITVSAIISSVSSQASARVLTQTEENDFEPFVNYSPGENPDIVSLSLGNNKFKESLTPEPDVIRESELVETRFDVITYSQSDVGALFLRREEFIAVSCECELFAPPSTASEAGRRPAIWAGDEYIEPEFVAKPYGVSANNIQSDFCDTCCQDHHDGGSGEKDPVGDVRATVYEPFRSIYDYWRDGSFRGDHIHYKKDKKGNLSPATSEGDVYVEACKLVRVDGYFRVAQDFRQEGLNSFQYDYLDQSNEVEEYSSYVTGAVADYVQAVSGGYSGAPAPLVPPARTEIGVTPAAAGDLTEAYTYLPTPLGTPYQQLRSRGIYVDYLSNDLRAVLNCLAAGIETKCESGNVKLDRTGSTNVLELVPFFDVQLTKLNRWTETPIRIPVDADNEPLKTNNLHSRGIARKIGNDGIGRVHASGHKGNIGLTDTDPIDLNFYGYLGQGDLEVVVSTDAIGAPGGYFVSGTLSSGVSGVQASRVVITGSDGAICDQSPGTWRCFIPLDAPAAEMTVSNYKKNNTNTVACSNHISLPGATGSDTSNNPITTFGFYGAFPEGSEDDPGYQISIEADRCG